MNEFQNVLSTGNRTRISVQPQYGHVRENNTNEDTEVQMHLFKKRNMIAYAHENEGKVILLEKLLLLFDSLVQRIC